jgi:hypothetical protein
MNSFIKYLNCGRVEVRTGESVDFVVTKFADLNENIIPFFQKYPLQGVKALDYADFCKVAELMKNKAHLTEEGLGQILKIKLGVNNNRIIS